MPGKRFMIERIIHYLREAEVLLAQGQTVGEVGRQFGVSERSYYRWRIDYNTIRLHSALGYRPLAPQTILPRRADLPSEYKALRTDQRSSDAEHGLIH